MAITAISITFVILNLLLLGVIDPLCFDLDSVCTRGFDRARLVAAEHMIQYGSFFHPTPYTTFPPGSGIFLAVTKFVGSKDFTLTIYLQVIALFATGWVTKKILEFDLPRYALLGLVLVVFNPNLLSAAYTSYAETFQHLFLALSMYFLYKCCCRHSLNSAIATGIFLAAATYVRPITQYLVVLLPVIFLFSGLLCVDRIRVSKAVATGLLAMTVAIVCMLPWLLHMNAQGEGWRMHPQDREVLFLYDNLRFLTPSMPGEGNERYKDKFIEDQEVRLSENVSNWHDLSPHQKRYYKREDLYSEITKVMFFSDPEVFLIALSKSTLRFFALGGSGKMFTLLYSDEIDRLKETHSRLKQEASLHRVQLEAYFESRSMFWPIKVTFVGFAIIMRILGLFGVIYLIKSKRYTLLLVVCGAIVYIFASHFVHGHPRFRIPTEAALAVLSVHGIAYLDYLLKTLKVRRW